jgi:Sec-independent protein translocase protein TatA
MEILGIGPLELFFILIIALIILGPNDMAKAGRTLGRFLRKIITSPEWRTVQKASRELKYLPNRLMREASLDDLSDDFADINKIGNDLNKEVRQVQSDLSSWTTPPELMDVGEPAPEPAPEVAPLPTPDPVGGTDVSPSSDTTQNVALIPAREEPTNPDSGIKTD